VAATLGTSDWHVKLSDDDVSVVCLIVSTAEHCQEMVRQLARALAAKLDPPELASRWVPGLPGVGCQPTVGAALSQPRAAAAAVMPNVVPPCSVDMSEEEEEFQTVITLCLSSLLLGIETKLEGALGAMARVNWAGVEMVGGGSARTAGQGAGVSHPRHSVSPPEDGCAGIPPLTHRVF
jgi:hypothetical protein